MVSVEEVHLEDKNFFTDDGEVHLEDKKAVGENVLRLLVTCCKS